jgi:hypothetical protein
MTILHLLNIEVESRIGSFADNSIGVDRGFYPIPAKALLGLSLEF